jgi:hypothetical protein
VATNGQGGEVTHVEWNEKTLTIANLASVHARVRPA